MKNKGKVYQRSKINVVDFEIKDVIIAITKFKTLNYRNQNAYINYMHQNRTILEVRIN